MDKTTLAFLVAVFFALCIVKVGEWMKGEDENLTDEVIV